MCPSQRPFDHTCLVRSHFFPLISAALILIPRLALRTRTTLAHTYRQVQERRLFGGALSRRRNRGSAITNRWDQCCLPPVTPWLHKWIDTRVYPRVVVRSEPLGEQTKLRYPLWFMIVASHLFSLHFYWLETGNLRLYLFGPALSGADATEETSSKGLRWNAQYCEQIVGAKYIAEVYIRAYSSPQEKTCTS